MNLRFFRGRAKNTDMKDMAMDNRENNRIMIQDRIALFVLVNIKIGIVGTQ